MFYNWKDSNNKDAERRSPEDVVGMRRFRTFLENTFWESPGKEDSVEHRSNKDAERRSPEDVVGMRRFTPTFAHFKR